MVCSDGDADVSELLALLDLIAGVDVGAAVLRRFRRGSTGSRSADAGAAAADGRAARADASTRESKASRQRIAWAQSRSLSEHSQVRASATRASTLWRAPRSRV